MSNAGTWLRERREELHLTLSGVERLTSVSASESSNERYRIRRGRLADLEEGKSAPDIFEVASISECYKLPYSAVLQAFGVSVGESRGTSEPSISGELSRPWSVTDTDRPFSLTFQSGIGFDATRLVKERPDELGVPAAVRLQLDLGQFRLGIVGVNDDTMGELVPAGSVVVIDRSSNTVETSGWRSILERPIYFVLHENGFSCSWCELAGKMLHIVPYPTSHQPVKIFKTPSAASVIGRVIHVWAPLIIRKPG
jgi:transcriptional regulator with XRE-family HTH domain